MSSDKWFGDEGDNFEGVKWIFTFVLVIGGVLYIGGQILAAIGGLF